jgi:hypothetical protein
MTVAACGVGFGREAVARLAIRGVVRIQARGQGSRQAVGSGCGWGWESMVCSVYIR